VSAPTATEPKFRLTAGKRGAVYLDGRSELVRDQTRFDALPAQPDGFVVREGSYADIAALANAANRSQMEDWDKKGKRLDYLYCPELVLEQPDVDAK